MRLARENGEILDVEPPLVAVPGDLARRLVDQERQRIRVIQPHLARADVEPAAQGLDRPVAGEARIELECDRPFDEQGRRLLVEGFEVGKADVAGLERQRGLIAHGGARLYRPPAGRAGRGHSGVPLLAVAIEDEVEVLVRHRAAGGFVVDLEAGVADGQPVEDGPGAGHRLGPGADEGGEVQAFQPGRPARQGDRRGDLVAGGGDRQRAVGGDPEAEAELVEFEPPQPDLAEESDERIHADLAARRREHRAALAILELQLAEAQSEAPRVVRDIGWPKLHHVGAAGTLLHRRYDPVVQPFEIDRTAGQTERQQRNPDERDEDHGLEKVNHDVPDPTPHARASIAGRKPHAFRCVHHALHGGAGARALSDPKSTDQTIMFLSCQRRSLEARPPPIR